jgi:hypothetical protein
MRGKRLSLITANMVYDILVTHAGAPESLRNNFVFVHTDDEDQNLCWEFRFQGLFGFGGKYRSLTNKIDYYSEDHTKKLDKLEAKVNKLLGELK